MTNQMTSDAKLEAAHDKEVARFMKAAKRIGCSDVTNMKRCHQHALNVAANSAYLSDAMYMAVETVLSVSINHI